MTGPEAPAGPSPYIPPAVAALPHDPRTGLPVPYASAKLANGRPDFSTVEHLRAKRCALERLCGVCGLTIGYWLAFLGTTRTVALATFHDPPMHVACARASLALCPHVARGHRVLALADGQRRDVTGWGLWITRSYQWGIESGRIAFAPAPAKTLETYTYGDCGVLVLTAEENPQASR